MQRTKLFEALFAYVNNIQITWKTIHLIVFCRQTVHLQIKAEQKEIIQNVLERKDSMAECYQRASERACVTRPSPFWTRYYISFFSYGYLKLPIAVKIITNQYNQLY
jgi:uncharacterized membrane protein